MRRSMLCSCAAWWCGVTEEYQSEIEVAGRGSLRSDRHSAAVVVY
jgi:hypothetical protein